MVYHLVLGVSVCGVACGRARRQDGAEQGSEGVEAVGHVGGVFADAVAGVSDVSASAVCLERVAY